METAGAIDDDEASFDDDEWPSLFLQWLIHQQQHRFRLSIPRDVRTRSLRLTISEPSPLFLAVIVLCGVVIHIYINIYLFMPWILRVFVIVYVYSEDAAKEALLDSYNTVASGFSAKLTPQQAEQISSVHNVKLIGVYDGWHHMENIFFLE